jgi:hypothetical protein
LGKVETCYLPKGATSRLSLYVKITYFLASNKIGCHAFNLLVEIGQREQREQRE